MQNRQITRRRQISTDKRATGLCQTGCKATGGELCWQDVNFGELTMRVTPGVVDGVVDDVKTEYSEDDLPLDPDLATVLLNWKKRCSKSEEGWMFPSHITGRCFHASPIQQDYIRPAGRKLGVARTPSATGIAPGSTRLALRWVCRDALWRGVRLIALGEEKVNT